MEIGKTAKPIVLATDQINGERLAVAKARVQESSGMLGKTNLRETLWCAEDVIIGLHEEVIEAYAHAYELSGQIRSTVPFEVFLRMHLLDASSGKDYPLPQQPSREWHATKKKKSIFRSIAVRWERVTAAVASCALHLVNFAIYGVRGDDDFRAQR